MQELLGDRDRQKYDTKDQKKCTLISSRIPNDPGSLTLAQGHVNLTNPHLGRAVTCTSNW